MRRIRRDSSVTASSAPARRLRARRPRCASASLGDLTEILALGTLVLHGRVKTKYHAQRGGAHLSRFERSRLYHVHRAESTRRIEHSSRSRSARAPPPSPRATRHRVCPFACARLPAAPPSRAKRPARPAAPRSAVERALGPLRPRGRSTRSAPPRATGGRSARAGTTPRPAAHDSRAERPRRPPRARRLPTYSYRQTESISFSRSPRTHKAHAVPDADQDFPGRATRTAG